MLNGRGGSVRTEASRLNLPNNPPNMNRAPVDSSAPVRQPERASKATLGNALLGRSRLNYLRNFLAFINKGQRGRIEAEAQSCRWRTVVKHMPQVGTASSAEYLFALHTIAVIDSGQNIFFGNGLEEARPTRS